MEADSIVAANDASAFRAFPLLLFLFQEALNAVLLNRQQVFDHAHMIETAVSLVECPEAPAREIAALIAEADEPFSQQVTLFAHKRAVLTARSATGTIGPVKTFGLQVILHRQVVGAQTTVHSARGNECFTHVM
jgi:hypothetical protein